MNPPPISTIIDQLLDQARAERIGQVEWLTDLLNALNAGEMEVVRDSIEAAIKVCGRNL